MQAYSKFASIYDKMMDNIPYADWKQYLLCLFYKNHIPAAAKIAELGCGTGTMTELLADDGFIMTGLDLSADMLKMAKKSRPALQRIPPITLLLLKMNLGHKPSLSPILRQTCVILT